MILLSVEELQDYCTCPILYEKKHVNKEPPVRSRSTAHFDGHSNVVERADLIIRQLTSFYFHRLMDNRQIRYETLYRKWENTWWKGYTAEAIMNYIVPVNRANQIRINTNLVGHLPKFHNKFHKPFKPLAVQKEVLFPVGEYVLTSTIQMAYRLRDGKTRIVKFVPYRIAPGDPKKDLSLIVQACGWMHNSGETEVEIAYYCMLSPDEYDPFTVATLDSKIVPKLIRIMQAFQNKEQVIQEPSCSGCEYKCKEKN
jgi:hypothetical protein